MAADYILRPIGVVTSTLKIREEAPNQENEGAPSAWIILDEEVAEGLEGIEEGHPILVLTWFHQSKRDILKLHPQWNKNNPLTGVFATRSPDRPNPVGLHQVKVLEKKGNRIRVNHLEAIDGTPVIDIKPVI